jgi:iron complex transport system ATP-binding protein
MLRLDAVEVALDGRPVVTDLTLRARPGEWLALIGPNGAGKTTALRAVAGQVDYAGSVTVGGDEVARLHVRELARRVALVPQTPVTPADLTVSEYVMLGRTPHIHPLGRESAADVAAVERALRLLDLDAMAERARGTLSGGERQRAILARALAQEAELLLLDEPITALDIGSQQAVLELVDRLRRELGLTVVAALHDLTLAGQFADRLLLMSAGRVVAADAPARVLTEERIARHFNALVDVLGGDAAPIVVPRRATPCPR